MSYKDTSPKYWAEYSNLQRVKHELIRNYINGWFPKVASSANTLVYVDTHAGRGRHLQGQLGSPLVALQAIAGHKAAPRLLARTRVEMRFIERDEDNFAALNEELSVARYDGDRIRVRGKCDDCFRVIETISDWLEKGPDGKQRWVPAFVFVDPYGFKVPASVLRRLLSFNGTELFVNFMWREMDMAIRQGKQSALAPTLDSVFGTPKWRTIADVEDYETRCQMGIQALHQGYAARWSTSFRMLAENGHTRYILMHLSNHDAGRDLMKTVMWKSCPQGGFYARKADSQQQEVLIQPRPNLEPLRHWVLRQLATPTRWTDLSQALLHTMWLERHLTQTIKTLARDGLIEDVDQQGIPVKKYNPMLALTAASKS